MQMSNWWLQTVITFTGRLLGASHPSLSPSIRLVTRRLSFAFHSDSSYAGNWKFFLSLSAYNGFMTFQATFLSTSSRIQLPVTTRTFVSPFIPSLVRPEWHVPLTKCSEPLRSSSASLCRPWSARCTPVLANHKIKPSTVHRFQLVPFSRQF